MQNGKVELTTLALLIPSQFASSHLPFLFPFNVDALGTAVRYEYKKYWYPRKFFLTPWVPFCIRFD